jgi:arylsulfatase A-like enzyme
MCDCRVPFYIRGPGLRQNVVNPGFGSHVDLAATLVSLAGGEVPPVSDGQPMPLQASAERGENLCGAGAAVRQVSRTACVQYSTCDSAGGSTVVQQYDK